MTASAPLRFPPGFLWGCASAAHQVEGGTDNDWTDFERRPGAIRDAGSAAIACDQWNRYREDLAAAAAAGQSAHRFSLEWSRIEPREGSFDEAALHHYSEVVDCCREHSLEPLVTLHHFTLPRWLAARGGVRAGIAAERFARFAAVCAERYGDRVSRWVTINEPMVLAALGHLYGEWPPQQRSLPAALGAARGLLRMHAAATAALRACARRRGRECLVSVAHHVRGMLPADPASPADRAAARLPDLFLNRWWLRACASGRMLPPVGVGERVPGAAGSLDWLGVNYYCDELVAFDWRLPGSLFARPHPDPRLPQSTFGWAIDPAGLRRALSEMWAECGLPIIVTENGVADHGDELRPRFLVTHLAAVHAALAEGVDVRGYMHWTQLDNFEWAQGYAQRFGLAAVDRKTQERRPKPSAGLYGRICADNAIAPELLDTEDR